MGGEALHMCAALEKVGCSKTREVSSGTLSHISDWVISPEARPSLHVAACCQLSGRTAWYWWPLSAERSWHHLRRSTFDRQHGERKCADTIGTVLVPWAGHFQRMLNISIFFQTEYTEAILSSSTRKLLWFEISKVLVAVLENNFIVSFTVIFGTISSPVARFITLYQRPPSSVYSSMRASRGSVCINWHVNLVNTMCCREWLRKRTKKYKNIYVRIANKISFASHLHVLTY